MLGLARVSEIKAFLAHILCQSMDRLHADLPEIQPGWTLTMMSSHRRYRWCTCASVLSFPVLNVTFALRTLGQQSLHLFVILSVSWPFQFWVCPAGSPRPRYYSLSFSFLVLPGGHSPGKLSAEGHRRIWDATASSADQASYCQGAPAHFYWSHSNLIVHLQLISLFILCWS